MPRPLAAALQDREAHSAWPLGQRVPANFQTVSYRAAKPQLKYRAEGNRNSGRKPPHILAAAAIPAYHTSMKAKFTAILRFEENEVVALSPELDIASQGATPAEALANLKEAVELFLETASPAELEGRLSEESWITQFETEYAPA